jgi:hypothetical protein
VAPDALLPHADRKTITRLRLAAQLVARRDESIRTPADVVRRLTAMQAQDFLAAKWAIGLRLPGTSDADVEAALADRSIVRSWPMRGTLHFVAAEDLGWIQSLTTERLVRSAASRHAQLGLTSADFDRARDASIAALAGGRALTREQMYRLFADAKVEPDGQRGYHTLWYLAQTGTLCLGAPLAKQQTFVLLDEWVPHPRRLEGDEALGELASRYFIGHGPATVRDFAWWASLTLSQARNGLAVARERLASLEFGGVDYFMGPEVLAAGTPDATSGVFMLPGFDEFLLGYQDRSAALAADHVQSVIPGKNGIFQPTIVRGGAIVGTWRRAMSAQRVVVSPTPFTPLPAAAKAGLRRAAQQYAAFLGLPLELAA